VNLDFLRVGATESSDGIVARSPMEGMAKAAGARFEVRDGWNVAAEFPNARRGDVSWADVSHLPKVELQGVSETITSLEFGTAIRRDDAWWCRLTESRALVIGAGPALDDGDLARVDELASGPGVLALVDELPSRQRAAITARIVQEREYAEIAEQLQCSEMVVRQHVSRGLAQLRGRLQEDSE